MEEGPVRIACFGDSLTEGYGLAPDEALPVVLERMLRDEGLAATCLNFGISGETAEDGHRRLDSVLAARPDAVVLEFGANDCFVGDPVDFVSANLAAMIEAFQEQNIPVLLVGISALLASGDEYKAAFDRLFTDLANLYGVPLFPDILSCYFGNSMYMLMDGMHPNELGVEAIARGLLPQVRDLVQAVSH